MYIRRKVFSVLVDETGEEKLYSVNETLFEGYEEREFAKRSDLEDYKSSRGYGRGMLAGGGLATTAVGINAGKKAAIKADEAGKTDYQIEKAAKKAGARGGAWTGAGLGVVSSAAGLGLAAAAAKKRGVKDLGKYAKRAIKTKKGAAGLGIIAAAPIVGAVTGGISGRLGAGKNTRERLEKRSRNDHGVKKVMGVNE